MLDLGGNFKVHLPYAISELYHKIKLKGERRDLNPRMMESQSIALPLGYARHIVLLRV